MNAAELAEQPIGRLLEATASATSLDVAPSLWGFGGAHGGLALAWLTVAMRAQAGGRRLRRVSGQIQRPLRGALGIDVGDEGTGRTVAWRSARARMNGGVAMSAQAIFAQGGHEAEALGPAMPVAPPPLDCPTFTVPPSIVPFARRTEIRPVGTTRPFSGAADPELLAWLRLVDDDLPPDEARLIVLMDALAPSYGAVLRTPAPIPTVTFTVTPGAGLARAASPWILLRARTAATSGDGWIDERLDAWAESGAHLGSGQQTRFLAA